jgi:hypothetical protein
MVEPLIAADDYEAAEKLMATAVTQAMKSKDTSLSSRTTAKSKEISDLKGKYEKLKKARETLASDPAEPNASLAVGRFQSFVKGNWVGGLPYLAKGSDPGLRVLAERELLKPAGEIEVIALADAWWEVSDKEPAPGKERGKDHASTLYLKALPKVSGITKTKVEKRLSEAGALKLAKGTWVDASDPKPFGQPGKPGDPIEMAAKAGEIKGCHMTPFPKGLYDGLTVRVSLDSSTAVSGWVIYDPVTFAVWIDPARGNFNNASNNGKSWHPDFTIPWTKNNEGIITILIEEGEYVVYLDHRERTRVKTLNPRMGHLGFEARDGPVKFDRIQFRKAE